MRKIAVLFPTRYRPEGFLRALDSWRRNSSASDMFLCFQKEDPHLDANISIAGELPYLVTENIGLTGKVNQLCSFFGMSFDGEVSGKRFPVYDGYMVLNDDQIIHTKDWDAMLLDFIDAWEREHHHRLVIPFWRDGIQDGKLPQGFATKELLEVTGSYYPQGFMRHLFSDNYFQHIGDVCKILRYLPDIYIEHLHFGFGKSAMDKNYAESQNHEAWQRDQQAYERWVRECSGPVIAGIRKAMGAEG